MYVWCVFYNAIPDIMDGISFIFNLVKLKELFNKYSSQNESSVCDL